MDKHSTCILSTILLAALINLTLEKNHSDINSVALGTSVNMKERDENMKNITGSAYPLQATPANLTPLVITNNSGTLMTKDISVFNPRNATSSTKICRNIDVRNKVSDLEVLRGCRVVQGFVQIVLIDLANETDFENYSFPELREVSQYLLFYRVTGLRSLGQLFPSLAIVRGTVVFQDYAVVVYEMMHLQEIGLTSLAEITRGAVRIEKNPNLCFVNTINWDLIAKWDSVKNYVRNNKNPDDCPGKSACEEAGCPLGLCWTNTDCQIQTSDSHRDCHDECIGGCFGPGPKACHACRKFLTLNMECVSTCSTGTYIHLNQRCVTKEHCLSLINHQSETSKSDATFVTFNGTCVQNCPAGYDYTADRTGCEQCEKGKCRKVCEGLNIDNIEAAQNLKDCTFINGSLEISIKHGNHRVLAKALEESLSSIEEIEGYLKIARCFPLVNLKFLDKLEIIHGKGTLENGKYSLIVLENQNLQELWNISTNFKILNGRIFFHYNPKLCFFYIENLILIINLTSINDFEVSQVSNGDKFACNITDIDLKFELVTSNSVVISINIPNPTNDHNNLGRYVLYYTEAVGRNLNPYEEVYGCGDDNWKVRDVLVDYDRANQQASTVQPSLKPFTRYAFYVKTYTTQTIGGLSPIYYIHTLPSRPSEVVINMYYSNTSSTIVLQWEPPRYHNGILTEYIVSGFWQQDDRAILDQRNYCIYPLEEETVETFPPDFQTNIEYEKKSCCSENLMIYRTHREFGRLCENIGLGKLSFIGENDQSPISSCTKYFYDYESNFMPNISGENEKNRNISEDNIMDHEHNEKSHRPIHDQSIAHNLSTGRLKRENLKNKFYQIVKNDTKTFVINNLYHFAKYTIFVRACRKTHRSENYDNYDGRCSKPEILTIRTLKDPQADSIDESLLAYKILEERDIQVVQISWVEPTNPNGLVLLFQIEHQRRDLENAKVITDCLTYLEYTQKGKKFIIKGLTQGAYLFRMRAVSLAGAGPFTNSFHFEIKNVSNKYFSKIFIFCTIALMFFVASISACYYVLHQRRQYFSDLDVLISPINNELTSTPFVEDSWEVPRENVELSKLMSQGSFGKVYEGILYPLKLPCTVKTVSNKYVNKDKILDEIKILKHAAGVHHMVQLLGVVLQSDPPLVVMEMMLLGDLKSFLRSTKEIPLLDLRFFRIAAQIADAMFFMEHNRFVHQDLAARNCMVHKNLTVKVGDFGWTRDLYSSDYVRKSDKEMMPIRWMAPESLKDGIYTSHSDVWSYGVVLWEVATLAEQPYRGLTNEQVLRWVIGGQILYTPVFCPHYLKTIMELCWNRSPNQRPTFRQLVSQLEQYTDDEFKCVSYYHTELSKKSNRVGF